VLLPPLQLVLAQLPGVLLQPLAVCVTLLVLRVIDGTAMCWVAGLSECADRDWAAGTLRQGCVGVLPAQHASATSWDPTRYEIKQK
jgi:hypothetical protein